MASNVGRDYAHVLDQNPSIEANATIEEILALASHGGSVTVTRGGRPVAELRSSPVARSVLGAPSGPADIEWLRRHRVGRLRLDAPDAGEFVSRMRDEDWR